MKHHLLSPFKRAKHFVLLVLVLAIAMSLLGKQEAAAQSGNMAVPLFGQRWNPWQGDLLGYSSIDTIGDRGCAVTDVAMVLKYYGASTDPRDLNNWLKANGGYVSDDLIVWGVAAGHASGVTYAGSNDWQNSSADLSVINAELDAGYPVIAEVRLSGSRHFVVIIGHSGSTYYINDPWYGDQSTINGRYPPLNDPAGAIYGIRKYHGQPATDTTPPFGNIDSPLSNATVNGVWTIAGWALDPESGVREVHLLLDGSDMGAVTYPVSRSDGNPGFQLAWDTTTAAIGAHTLTLHIVNNVGLTQDYTCAITVSRAYLLLRGYGENTVHLISGGTRRAFTTADTFNDWGQDWSSVQDVPRSIIDQYSWDVPIAHLIKTANDATAYWIQDGYRRPIDSADLFNEMGFYWSDLVNVSTDRLNYYPPWNDLSSVEPRLIVMSGPVISPPAACYVGNPISASFRVRNIAVVGSTVQSLLCSVRGPNGEIADFPASGSVYLGQDQETDYTAQNTYYEAGRYTYNSTYLINNNQYHVAVNSGLLPDVPGYFDILPADPVVSLDLAPNPISGGQTTTATIHMGGPAPAGGVSVTLSSSDTSLINVPGSVTVPPGASSVTVSLTPAPVSTTQSAVISATNSAGWTQQATLSVIPPGLASMQINPGSVTGGSTATGSITITGPAPANGIAISLGSSDTSVATVPTSVTVPAGTSSATFTISTLPVASTSSVSISAEQGGVQQTASLSVQPAMFQTFSLSSSIVAGSKSVTGKITLNGPAPSGGAVVTLTNTNPAATVPSSVTIPSGSSSKSFTITTVPVTSIQTGTITASYNGVSKSVKLKVRPISVNSIALTPNPVIGSHSAAGTLTLEAPAEPGAITITLSSSNTAVALPTPTTVTIPAGQITGAFTVNTAHVTAATVVYIRAKANGITRSKRLTVNP